MKQSRKVSEIVEFLRELSQIIEERRQNPRPDSYTCKLLASGENEILKKIGEEAIEVILAAKAQGRQRIVEEASDLMYHLLVMFSLKEISLEEIEAELRRRHRG
jgi:phosphoribosyl-ATP pyrophosphohydrolase